MSHDAIVFPARRRLQTVPGVAALGLVALLGLLFAPEAAPAAQQKDPSGPRPEAGQGKDKTDQDATDKGKEQGDRLTKKMQQIEKLLKEIKKQGQQQEQRINAIEQTIKDLLKQWKKEADGPRPTGPKNGDAQEDSDQPSRPLEATLPGLDPTRPAAAATLPGGEANGQAEPTGRPLPIGVADAAGKVGYVPGAKGGIEAVDLENGKTLWTVKENGKPLAVAGNLLAVQVGVPGKANAIRIAVLDTRDKGKQVRISDPVAFPEWVSTELTHGRSFSAQAHVEKNDLVYHWDARAFYAGGAPPPPEVIEASKKSASGVARVDLDTGKVTMLPADKTPAGPKVKLPEELAKLKSQQYWTGFDWKTEPFVVGKTVSALAVMPDGGVTTLSLKRWDLATGKSLKTVELLRGKELWPQVARDGSHIFVHQALVKEQLPPGDYAWWVFSLETGKQVGKFPYDGPLTNLVVLGPRAYFLVATKGAAPNFEMQPRALRAIDVTTGKTLWEHPVEGERRLLPLP